jgi:predicted Fe-Mo cluster-binding NifX family protein
MIAIPVDSATPGVKSSKLFGNVPIFAIYRPVDEEFYFTTNQGAGDGVKTAKQLKAWGVKSVVYSYMGEGPFRALNEDGLTIYYLGKEPMALFEIIRKLKEDAFVKVDSANAQSYLDPGTETGECRCGCDH